MKKLKFRDIKELAQCLIVIKLHSEDLTGFVGLGFVFFFSTFGAFLLSCLFYQFYHVLSFSKFLEFIPSVYGLVIIKLCSTICILEYKTF